MITMDEVKQISTKLSEENMGIADDSLSEDISSIIYYSDVIECDDTVIIHRHIDIDYSFGDYFEVCEDTKLFQCICTLCNLPLLQEEQEIVIYQID